MNQTLAAAKKLPPLSAMGEYETMPVFEEQARSQSVMDDPFYKNAPGMRS